MKLKLGERYSANETMVKLGCTDIDRIVPKNQKADVARTLIDVQSACVKDLPENVDPKMIMDMLSDAYILGRLHERNM